MSEVTDGIARSVAFLEEIGLLIEKGEAQVEQARTMQTEVQGLLNRLTALKEGHDSDKAILAGFRRFFGQTDGTP